MKNEKRKKVYVYTVCLCDDNPLISGFLKWSREKDRERQGGTEGANRASMGLFILVPDPSVRPAQSSPMGSSQPQEDT